jgi:hypothetical protein
MLYVTLREHWCYIIVLNVHATTENEIYDMKDSFYEELERVFDKFPKYCMKILLGDFSAEVDREHVYKPTIGNESLHGIYNDNGVRVVNFAVSKNLLGVQCSHIVTFINLLGHLLMERGIDRIVMCFSDYRRGSDWKLDLLTTYRL